MSLRPLIAIGLALPLAACLSLGGKPPKLLLTLTPAATMAPGTARTARDGTAVTVIPPSVPQEIAVLRLLVHSGTTVTYLKDVQWTDAPNRLFRDLLAEAVAVRTSHPVLDIRQFSLAPGIRLTGRLESFGIDADTAMAVVTYDAALSRPGVEGVVTRRFETRVAANAANAAAAGGALNQAANQVAADVADWIGG